MEELNLVKVFECEAEHEARLLESALQEAGINAIITGLEASALGVALDGPDVIQIMVDRPHAEAALALTEEFTVEEDEPVPAWTCQCGEEVDAGFFICWSCQAEYGDQQAGESS